MALESLDASGCQVPFSLEPILAELEAGRYVGPIPLTALEDLVSRANGRGGGSGGGGESGGGSSGGNGGGVGATATTIKSSSTGDARCEP